MLKSDKFALNRASRLRVINEDNPDVSIEDDFGLCEVVLSKEQRVKPGSLGELASANFGVEFELLAQGIRSYFQKIVSIIGIGEKLSPAGSIPDCMGFILDDEAVRQLDKLHEKAVDEPKIIRLFYEISVAGLDLIYPGKPIQRFWVLEVIARIPYFSYVSVLHLYESLGWWQNQELSKVHFAEAYAEQHHLLIMEALGGNRRWFDRFVAQHTALIYYWVIVGCYLVSPKWSYYFMQLVEQHAADTYAQFVSENASSLALYPPPDVAVQFYRDGDMYMFDEFHAGSKEGPLRRPPVDNLLQVFENIRDDELEHVKTMVQCQDYDWLASSQVSPHSKKREDWAKWAQEINETSENKM
eukprot:CAMPEP_0196579816 /NCGR_PEP_ID=MMETSP1081-20130531/24918_1 /TAXON_ID=36882 /ORGANISM="Pyramimonas amylifera, Strain CCMP720" /LENGTH=355 /DNA_ID=CAMNT_0041899511 /DNA_START=386 /DNA_END=1453 /DNA_ORIENTATION=+